MNELTIIQNASGLYGLQNQWGIIKQSCIYDRIEYCDDRFWTYKDGAMGCVDGECGNTLVSCNWEKVVGIECYYSKVTDGNGKWGVVSDSDELLFPCQWDDIKLGVLERFVVKHNDKWGVVDMDGTPIIPCRWDAIEVAAPYYVVKDSCGKYGLYDEDGAMISDCLWSNLYASNRIDVFFVKDRDGYWGVMDDSGVLVSSCMWRDIKVMGGFFCVIGNTGQMGVMDRKGKLLIPCQYKAFIPCNMGDGFIVVDKENKYGDYTLIKGQPHHPDSSDDDNSWELAIRCKWTELRYGFDGLIARNSEGLYGLIRKDGTSITPCKWKSVGFNNHPYYIV